MSKNNKSLLVVQIILLVVILVRMTGVYDRVTGNVISDEVCSFAVQQIERLERMRSTDYTLEEERYREIERELWEFNRRTHDESRESIDLMGLIEGAYFDQYRLGEISENGAKFAELDQKIIGKLERAKELLRKYCRYED